MSQPSLSHRYLDGPMFVDWLYEEIPELDGHASTLLDANDIRRIFDYKQGTCPEAYGIPDRICVSLGLHLDDIPDRVWRTVPAKPARYERRRRNATPWEKKKALAMLEEGYLALEIAGQVGVTPRTVTRWKKAAA